MNALENYWEKVKAIPTKRKLIILGIFTLVFFIAFVLVMVKMIKLNKQCVDDPFKYAAQRLESQEAPYSCSCQALHQDYLDFSFNGEEGIKILPKGTGQNFNSGNIIDICNTGERG